MKPDRLLAAARPMASVDVDPVHPEGQADLRDIGGWAPELRRRKL